MQKERRGENRGDDGDAATSSIPALPLSRREKKRLKRQENKARNKANVTASQQAATDYLRDNPYGPQSEEMLAVFQVANPNYKNKTVMKGRRGVVSDGRPIKPRNAFANSTMAFGNLKVNGVGNEGTFVIPNYG